MVVTGSAVRPSTFQRVLGRGAVARPRQALVAAAAVLFLAVGGLLVITKPWSDLSTSREGTVESLTHRLARTLEGPGATQMGVTWATPQYLELTGQQPAISRFGADRNLLFLMMETIHTGDLPRLPRLVLRQGGMDMAATRVVSTVSSAHHRLTVVVFPKMAMGGSHAAMEGPVQIVVPPVNSGGESRVLSWNSAAGTEKAAQPGASLHLTWTTLLALFGGLLSSMWPCLFQLSVYFVPTLAGLSAVGPEGAPRKGVNARVMKAAGAFVLGFVIVYTAAGAAAGFAAQSLGGTSAFWHFRREMTLVAGVVLLLMALRLAANGRAPLVCKMPLGNFLKRKRVGYLGTMLLGVCFAVGCTTCFGAAIVLGMITYVGVAGTPLTGALIMLVFALGMAIPLMLGSLLMARVVAYLGRMEKAAPYMVLGASAVMAGFAVLLLSGHYMALSNVVARTP